MPAPASTRIATGGDPPSVMRRTRPGCDWCPHCVVGLLAWGAFAYGAVFRWGYVPLMVGCVLVGVAAGASRVGRTRPAISRTLVAALALLSVAVLLQLIPVMSPL